MEKIKRFNKNSNYFKWYNKNKDKIKLNELKCNKVKITIIYKTIEK